MRNRFFILIIIFALVSASFALLLSDSDHNGSVTLAELTLSKDGKQVALDFDQFAPAVRDGRVWLASLELESIFYAVIGICGILLALRAIISAAQIVKEEHAAKKRERRKAIQVPETMLIKELNTPQAARPVVPGSDLTPAAVKDTARRRWWGRRSQNFTGRSQARWAPYTHSLTGRMIIAFTGIVAAFGALTIAIVYFTLTASLRRHAIQRARVMAVNVSDSAPNYLLKKNAKGLRELLRKHANRPEVAYILVRGSAGEILAHSFAVLPQEVRGPSPAGEKSSEGQRALRISDGEVYEVSVPILDGQIGAVRLGVWRDEIDAEISRTVTPLVKVLLLVIGGGILMVIYFVWRINRPIMRLVRAARMISSGDLEAPSLGTEDETEFGELSRALERMRSSIKAALVRLEK